MIARQQPTSPTPSNADPIAALWERTREAHLEATQGTFATLQAPFAQWVSAGKKILSGGGKILFFGNGGSAADAQHLATELTVRYEKNRPALAALSLATDSSALTAIGNDLGFENLFARQIAALGAPADMAIAISTSGTSPNILAALSAAREKKIFTVGLGGRNGGTMKALCDLCLIVPSESTARIQEMHITLGHMFCEAMESL